MGQNVSGLKDRSTTSLRQQEQFIQTEFTHAGWMKYAHSEYEERVASYGLL